MGTGMGGWKSPVGFEGEGSSDLGEVRMRPRVSKPDTRAKTSTTIINNNKKKKKKNKMSS